MNYDIITAGVGGQGILSISAIIASSALQSGLFVKQAEEHGMSQRGGAVVSHLRLSDEPIHSDLVSPGRADMIVSMEPVESLRYLSYLSPGGNGAHRRRAGGQHSRLPGHRGSPRRDRARCPTPG